MGQVCVAVVLVTLELSIPLDTLVPHIIHDSWYMLGDNMEEDVDEAAPEYALEFSGNFLGMIRKRKRIKRVSKKRRKRKRSQEEKLD